MSWEHMTAKRSWTVVIMTPKGSNVRKAFELITDGNTCFVDVKLWKGVYQNEHTLSKWKTEVSRSLVLCKRSSCRVVRAFFRSICMCIIIRSSCVID